ncbi:MAG TPA: dynamin family protein [Thermoanaerobaculia bacterium]|nr:dynamin family protein [Thermoanaerobaculia bacterium]
MSGLNENHHRSLRSAFKHIDKLLADAQAAWAGPGSPFATHFPDLTPTQQRVIADYIARVRDQMADSCRALGISLEPPRVAASWSVQTAVSFAQIAVAEIAPSRLEGYGPLDRETTGVLERLEADLERTLQRLQAYLVQGLGRDLAERLKRLERSPVDLALLRRLERIVTDRGLIEFRGALEALVERLESDTFEIAVFGRVSSGKSSLLNTVLGFPALPVGVTPVTSVPTRVLWGESPSAEIRFADAPVEEIALARLPEFVSEQQNPDNRKHVTRATVKLPSPILRQGVVFVDTPGVGSLATAGARESYAYLPRCDLGILLLDAASTPSREDLEILRLLYDSAIPGKVVISKADLISETDRARMRDYVRTTIAGEMGLDLPVDYSSAVGPSAALTRAWFERELEPLTARAHELAQASARRKLASLREGVAAALRVALEARARGTDEPAQVGAAALERLALEAEGRMQECRRRCEAFVEEARGLARPALQLAAREYARIAPQGHPGDSLAEVTHRILSQTGEELRGKIRQELVSLRDKLQEFLADMTREAGEGIGQLEELQLGLVTQPALIIPPEVGRIDLRPGGLIRNVSSLVERRAQSRLFAEFAVVEREFLAFSRRLRDWLRSAAAGLADQFVAQAEPLRAMARRATQGADPGELDGLAADLAELTSDVQPDSVINVEESRRTAGHQTQQGPRQEA